eukprot:5952802-Prymnesium_polylepis.1
MHGHGGVRARAAAGGSSSGGGGGGGNVRKKAAAAGQGVCSAGGGGGRAGAGRESGCRRATAREVVAQRRGWRRADGAAREKVGKLLRRAGARVRNRRR